MNKFRRQALDLIIRELRIEAAAAETQRRHLQNELERTQVSGKPTTHPTTRKDLLEAISAEVRANRRLRIAEGMFREITNV